MTKKLSGLSRQERRIIKRERTTSRITKKNKNELKQLTTMKEQSIDYSDIPELDFNQLGKPLIGRFYKPIKKPISIRLDSDVLDWFKHSAKKYQSLINVACRKYMADHRSSTKVVKVREKSPKYRVKKRT